MWWKGQYLPHWRLRAGPPWPAAQDFRCAIVYFCDLLLGLGAARVHGKLPGNCALSTVASVGLETLISGLHIEGHSPKRSATAIMHTRASLSSGMQCVGTYDRIRIVRCLWTKVGACRVPDVGASFAYGSVHHAWSTTVNELVKRLSEGSHEVEVSLRPESDINRFREMLDRGHVLVKFTQTRGGTELGFTLDRSRSDLTQADLKAGTGQVRVVGELT